MPRHQQEGLPSPSSPANPTTPTPQLEKKEFKHERVSGRHLPKPARDERSARLGASSARGSGSQGADDGGAVGNPSARGTVTGKGGYGSAASEQERRALDCLADQVVTAVEGDDSFFEDLNPVLEMAEEGAFTAR